MATRNPHPSSQARFFRFLESQDSLERAFSFFPAPPLVGAAQRRIWDPNGGNAPPCKRNKAALPRLGDLAPSRGGCRAREIPCGLSRLRASGPAARLAPPRESSVKGPSRSLRGAWIRSAVDAAALVRRPPDVTIERPPARLAPYDIAPGIGQNVGDRLRTTVSRFGFRT
jgi:hypothetical protein